MRRPKDLGPVLAAAFVAAAVLALQVASVIIPPVGLAIRKLPLIPIALVAATLLVSFRVVRSR
jgi:hypothetical protein